MKFIVIALLFFVILTVIGFIAYVIMSKEKKPKELKRRELARQLELLQIKNAEYAQELDARRLGLHWISKTDIEIKETNGPEK